MPLEAADNEMSTSGMPRFPPSLPNNVARSRHAKIAAVPVSVAPVGQKASSHIHLVLFSAGALVAVVALMAVIVALNSRKPITIPFDQIPSFNAQDPIELV
jgi:hypothetical protein